MTLTWTRNGTGPLEPASSSGPLAPSSTDAGRPGSQAPAARKRAGELLVDLYRYLSAHAERYPALASLVPLLKDAVAEHRSGTALDPLDGVRRVAREIGRARAADPSIPDS